jgi:hypothetical protein
MKRATEEDDVGTAPVRLVDLRLLVARFEKSCRFYPKEIGPFGRLAKINVEGAISLVYYE